MNNRDMTKRNIVEYTVLLLVSMGLCSLLIINDRSGVLLIRGSGSYLLYPFVPVFAGKLVESIIKASLSGRLAKTMADISSILGWGMALFLFFYMLPQAGPVNRASLGIPFLVIIYVVKSRLLCYARQYVIGSAVLKFVLFLLQGIIAGLMVSAVWKGGVWHIGINISASAMVFFGFLVLALSMLLSLLELSKQEQLIAVGKWFSKATASKFIFGCILVFVIKDLPETGNNYPQYFIYIKWFLLFVVLLVLFFVLFNKIRNEASDDPGESLRKHMQEITYNKEYEVKELSKYLDEYIIKGDLSNTLIVIADAGKRSSINTERMGRIIKPMLVHEDLPLPLICLKSEKLLNEKRSAEKRREIIEKVIAEIKHNGRN